MAPMTYRLLTPTRAPVVRDLIESVLSSPLSSFYRRLYDGISPEATIDLPALPLLTKAHLQDTPPAERCYVSPHELSFVAYTSGTTSGVPLVLYFSPVDNYHFDPTLSLDVHRLLITYPPLNKNFGHTFIQQCRQSPTQPLPVFGDYQNLANSAVLAAETRADALYATATIARDLAPHLATRYDPNAIKLLALGSETLTPTGRAHLQSLYPSAKIANLYASSEMGQYILYPCTHLLETGADAFHILTDAVTALELVDGELVVTYTKNAALPLIRYRTGDSFSVTAESCPCGLPGPLLKWEGRAEVDKVRTAGVEIQVSDIEAVFAPLTSAIGHHYQVHLYESTPNAPTRIVVEIVAPTITGTTLEALSSERVCSQLLAQWQLTPTSVLGELVAAGRFTKPEVRFVDALSQTGAKTRHLIHHTL